MTARRGAGGLALAVLPAAVLLAQEKAEPPVAFPAGVEQVIVDVVITDKKGNTVTGLTKDGMIVTEDGVPQTIVSFEAVDVPELPVAAPPPRPRVSTNAAPEDRRGRTFVILFDDIHMTRFRAREAKAAVASFLETGMREGDRVTLVSSAEGGWWTSRMEAGRADLIALLKRFEGRYIPDHSPDRMSDWEAMRIHMYRDPMVTARVMRRFETYGVSAALSRGRDSALGGTSDDPFVTGRASEVYFAATTRNRLTLEMMERSLMALVGVKGRKSLILVSEGFIYDPNLDEFKRVTEAARRANTAIYFVNARGLEGMPSYFTAEFGPALPDQDVGFAFTETIEAVAGSDTVAVDSGGFVVRNTNDLASGIQRIHNETRSYYLLGYNPTNIARDGRFRKIQVKLVEGEGREVRARKGYYAPSDEPKTALKPKEGIDPVLQAALDSPHEEDGIPLRLTEYVAEEVMLGKAAVKVAIELDIRSLSFEKVDDRDNAEVDILLIVAHRETGEFFRYDQKVTMRLKKETRDRLNRFWYPIVRDFELRPGSYQAKMVVREGRTRHVGTVLHEFEVPPLDQFRVSTPILSDTRLPDTDPSQPPVGRLALLARREFPQGEQLFCQFEVFGAAKDPKTGMPRVANGYLVRRSDGVVYIPARPSVINPTSLGKLTRFLGFSLEGATPGEYEIVMTFEDEVGGRRVEVREPFSVVPAPPAAPAAGS
ncbi:MAG: hypothetical protein A2V74_10225 [Acidobacteria bacterium RBG_16_70_10]|nr:MAG: hypothetical protein A2V74_10225 [Acidobacteria bacterium RBG_16_70_10]